MSSQIGVIGHRGWPARFPDNTLPGLLAASGVCDGVEVDVRRSSDGKLVLSHDPSIGNLEVAGSPWKELSELDLGGGAGPCLLDEAIAALLGVSMFVEIKNSPGVRGFEPDHRLALEAASRARPFDIVISFHWSSVDAVRLTFPEVATGLNVGVLGDLDEAVRHALHAGHRHLILDVDLLIGSSVDIPSELSVQVWSSRGDEAYPGAIDELASKGVSGIITDDPPATRRLLGRLDDDQG